MEALKLILKFLAPIWTFGLTNYILRGGQNIAFIFLTNFSILGGLNTALKYYSF